MSEHPRCVERGDLRSIAFDALPSEVAVLDEDGTILETNGTWSAFASENGIAIRPDMVGENYLDVADDAPGDESATDAAAGIRAVLGGERDEFSFEYPCHSPDERRWFMMRVIAVHYDGRRCALVVHTDITDRREAEIAVQERNDQLELLAGVLSHDLRNPMNVALGRAGLLEDDDEQVATIVASLERMNAIVEDALLLVRETDVEERVVVDLPTVARDAWSHVATADATLAVDATAPIEADQSLLSQALENLFRNALENAGDDARVTVGPLTDGFYVADDGPGVPPDRREDVFDPGYTTNKADGGTGLGLAIVERIADAHGWEVTLTEAADGGARFEFTGVGAPE